MSYRVELLGRALKHLDQVPLKLQRRIRVRIDQLKQDPRPPWTETLEGKLRALRRFQVGRYRIGYHVDDASRVVTITAIGDVIQSTGRWNGRHESGRQAVDCLC